MKNAQLFLHSIKCWVEIAPPLTRVRIHPINNRTTAIDRCAIESVHLNIFWFRPVFSLSLSLSLFLSFVHFTDKRPDNLLNFKFWCVYVCVCVCSYLNLPNNWRSGHAHRTHIPSLAYIQPGVGDHVSLPHCTIERETRVAIRPYQCNPSSLNDDGWAPLMVTSLSLSPSLW